MTRSLPPPAKLLAICASALLLLSLAPTTQASFNYEVEKRVFERVNDFMSGPVVVTSLLERFRKNGAFTHNLNVSDKNAYSQISFGLLNEYKFDMIYYGTEDGIFVGYHQGTWGTYREPVNSGYFTDDQEMEKYYHACVDRETGDPRNCTISAGSMHVKCVNDCEVALCPDDITQDCETSSDPSSCRKEQKWCPQYEINPVTEFESTYLGYVPRTYHCHTPTGEFSQEPGEVLQSDGELGNCLYGDDRTLVNRQMMGDYMVCGQNNTCNPFVGGFRSRDYDARYRGWYKQTKAKQRPNWVEPYPFFSNLDLGITYSAPFYEYDETNRRQIFRGVFAIDYTFEDISKFLQESYGTSSTADDQDSSSNDIAITNSDETHVVIYEAKEPNYMVAASTGRSAASKVLKDDPTQACPDDAKDDNSCDVVRVKMSELAGRPFDEILLASYQEQVKQSYPRNLVDARVSDEPGAPAYVSQSSFYSSGEELEWIILVISPVDQSESDALTPEDGLFGVVCVIASLGFLLCLAMFISFMCKRKSRAVILADWRFTSAFLLGCALLNLSSFTFLGENTEALCLARMWSFHFLFALALSPLFVKVYRMYRLVGTASRNPAIISNPKAVAMSLPIVLIQVIVLTVFTIVDPPRPENIIEFEDTVVTQRVECSTDTVAFTGTVLGYECGLVVIGCTLAFLTRNLDSGFGQAKELMFSMYNIAFIGLIIVVISFAMDIDASGQIILFALGIFCGTVFSSAAFVLPRLMRSKEEQRSTPRRKSGSHAVGLGQRETNKKQGSKRNVRSVNFSQNLEHEIDDRPVTGWSAVEDDFEDAATGLKRASSIAENEDDVWTAPANENASLANVSVSSDILKHHETEKTASEDPDKDSDILSFSDLYTDPGSQMVDLDRKPAAKEFPMKEEQAPPIKPTGTDETDGMSV